MNTIKEEHYEIPFKEFDKPLKEVLMSNYLKPVSKWLAGERQNALLAMEAKSVWETGLSAIFLADMDEEEGEDGVALLSDRASSISSWLLSKRMSEVIQHNGKEITVYHWDKVTWDTSVVVRSLLIMIDKYHNRFSDSDKNDIIETCESACIWLYYMFLNWDNEVKYPFGPADLGQILTTILLLQEKFPQIYTRLCKQFNEDESKLDIATQIARKLLSIKTEYSSKEHQITIPISDEKKEIVTYWWDDFFSSAEVVEALALFYVYCVNSEKENSPLLPISDKSIKTVIREALVRACLHFEKEQLDGMWGNHIDTIKVLYAYVRVRDLVPKDEETPIVTPEVHTVFKALRWMCDEKQIFKDDSSDENSPKSFMHTMYLTVFYAHTLLEIYKRWDPVHHTLGKVYDDVVWSSPTRTTPERAKRLALELEFIKLSELQNKTENKFLAAKRLTQLTFFSVLSFLLVFFGFGKWSNIVESSFAINFQQQGSSIDLIALFIALLVVGASVVFGINRLFKK